jgi:hypothetical protein
MSHDTTRPARPAHRHNQAMAAFAVELAKGIGNAFPRADRLELVSYLVTWAVADLAQTTRWPDLRRQINDTLAGSVAAGLDVGLGLAGHTCIVDSAPPYTRPPQ